jgi:hypothetical protein
VRDGMAGHDIVTRLRNAEYRNASWRYPPAVSSSSSCVAAGFASRLRPGPDFSQPGKQP